MTKLKKNPRDIAIIGMIDDDKIFFYDTNSLSNQRLRICKYGKDDSCEIIRFKSNKIIVTPVIEENKKQDYLELLNELNTKRLACKAKDREPTNEEMNM